jgi:hypothetical protein
MAFGMDTATREVDTAATEQTGYLVGTDRVVPTDASGRANQP